MTTVARVPCTLRPADAIGRRIIALVGIGYAGRYQRTGILGGGAQSQIAGARGSGPAGLASLEGDAHLATDAPGVDGGIDHETHHQHHEQNAQPDTLFHAKKLPMWRNLV